MPHKVSLNQEQFEDLVRGKTLTIELSRGNLITMDLELNLRDVGFNQMQRAVDNAYYEAKDVDSAREPL